MRVLEFSSEFRIFGGKVVLSSAYELIFIILVFFNQSSYARFPSPPRMLSGSSPVSGT